MRYTRILVVLSLAAAACGGNGGDVVVATPEMKSQATTASDAQAATTETLGSASAVAAVSSELTAAASGSTTVSLVGMPAPTRFDRPGASAALITPGGVARHSLTTPPSTTATGCLFPDSNGDSVHVASGDHDPLSGTACPNLGPGSVAAFYQDGCTVTVTATGSDTSWTMDIAVGSQLGGHCGWTGTHFHHAITVGTTGQTGTAHAFGSLLFAGTKSVNTVFDLTLQFSATTTGGTATLDGNVTDHVSHVKATENVRLSVNETGTSESGTTDVSIGGATTVDLLDTTEARTLHEIKWSNVLYTAHEQRPSPTPATQSITGSLLFDGAQVASLELKNAGVYIRWTDGAEDPWDGKGFLDFFALFALGF